MAAAALCVGGCYCATRLCGRRPAPYEPPRPPNIDAWLAEHAGEWGLDADRVSIGGFSGGGNLAASACLQARDGRTATPLLQVLAVPSLDVAGDVHGKPSTIAHPMIGPELLKLVRATYFKDASRRSEPYASPLLADSVAGLPPSLVITAAHDSLRAEGDAYAARLADAGVRVEHHVVPRRDHYFLDGSDHAQAGHWMGLMADRIAQALAT